MVAQPTPTVRHDPLDTTFIGLEHALSTSDSPIHQYRGIQYAIIPARWRQSRLCSAYAPGTDATRYGPICPQTPYTSVASSGGLMKQTEPLSDEFQCLNLNITCPGGLLPTSRVPVMLWVHGGGKQGSGSHWMYDGGSIVHRSMLIGRPVIVITFNYRLGVLGSAASPALREDNNAACDEGVGNYGLRDQRKALEWVHQFIAEFGGNPDNVTLFGESTGASDILCHTRSADNLAAPLFQRAIVQSPLGSIEHDALDVPGAGYHLSKLMPVVHATSIDELRQVDVQKLVKVASWQSSRATDDGVFFMKGWRDHVSLQTPRHSFSSATSSPVIRPITPLAPLIMCPPSPPTDKLPSPTIRATVPAHTLHQPIIIGDCAAASELYNLSASLWDAASTVRRIRAIVQSMRGASALLRAYDISPHTEDDELPERVEALLGDARFAWPCECAADTLRKQKNGRGVWRYVFDEDAPIDVKRGDIRRHAPDLAFLFDAAPPSEAPSNTGSVEEVLVEQSQEEAEEEYQGRWGYGDVADEDDDEEEDTFDDGGWGYDQPDDDEYAHKIRNTLQERWIAFAHGDAPWHEDRVFVFGPEGETGERKMETLETRRRKKMWRDVLEPLGLRVIQKLGVELSNGPLMAMA